MPITFYCTDCNQKLRIPDDSAGRPVACPRCGARLRVPDTPDPEPAPPEPPPAAPALPKSPPAAVPAGKPPAVPVPADAPVIVQETREKRSEIPLVVPSKKIDFEDLIDMTSMVDVVFFLLIFFLVTSMHALDSTIPLPAPDPQKAGAREQRSVADIDADDAYIVVRIDKNDVISVEGAEVRGDRDLLFRLRDLRLGASRPDKLLVVGHGDASNGKVVMVLDTGREAGIEQMRLSVQDETE